MKYYGSILEFTHERNADLLRAFREQCALARHIKISEIARKVVESPSKRFWVSEMRAMIVCSEIMRGRPVLDTMRPTKREMFLEIFRRVCELRKLRPDAPLIDLTTEVVNSPAPKFYMEARSARTRLCKIRSKKNKDGYGDPK